MAIFQFLWCSSLMHLCLKAPFSVFPFFSFSPGSGILLFIFHANFLNEITARLCGPCAVHAVVLNEKFQLPIFLVKSLIIVWFIHLIYLCHINHVLLCWLQDSHFIYSFSPVPGINKLFIRLAEAPTAKVKDRLYLCIQLYMVQCTGKCIFYLQPIAKTQHTYLYLIKMYIKTQHSTQKCKK